ncbi:UNVERIFIED_CONTAM: hypothetical protein Sangu_0184300 [Sesamum angustifolium]|uniref:Retrotransposon Copia-like N-terminal domain-containing protein n=1 Tax=Sesamum angustifolium TaxID=2727405 RepID=A0AAW2RLR2_9LAMI
MIESTTATTSTTNQRPQHEYEVSKLEVFDNPGMMLVSVLLNGTSWLSWSRAVHRSLRAKSKLGFITGECVKPAMGTEGYEP